MTDTNASNLISLWPYEPPGMRHLGVIDLGSNTTRLVIYGYVPGRAFRIEDAIRAPVRLGEGMGDTRVLRARPMQRAIDALRLFKQHADAYHVSDIIFVATAATRDAVNGQDFLTRLRAETGLDPRILSGEAEAYYGYVAAVNSLRFTDGLVIDIGGGSAELTRVAQRHMTAATSLPYGAVRVTERYLHTDPVKKGEMNTLLRETRDAMKGVAHLSGGGTLVGMGGTVRALAKMDRAQSASPIDHLHGHVMLRATVDRIIDQLRELPIARRSTLPGLSSDRADVILGGAAVLQTIMDLGSFGEVVVSNQGIREGLFYERFLTNDTTPTTPDNPPLIDDIRAFGVHNLVQLYGGPIDHFARVRDLSLSLFDQLTDLHGYGTFERDVLSAAAWLHDVGVVVDYWEHHLHSAYIILNASLPGWSHRELALIALLARNHRKGSIGLAGLSGALDSGDVERVEKLSALLRLAEYLERGKTGVVTGVHVHVGPGWVQIEAAARGDASVEIWEANRNADLFQRAYSRELEIMAVATPTPPS